MRKKKQNYIQHEKKKKEHIQYAKASCCFGQQPSPPAPPHPNRSRSSLKTPRPNVPRPHPYISAHTQNITKHDYVTKPVSLEKGEAL